MRIVRTYQGSWVTRYIALSDADYRRYRADLGLLDRIEPLGAIDVRRDGAVEYAPTGPKVIPAHVMDELLRRVY